MAQRQVARKALPRRLHASRTLEPDLELSDERGGRHVEAVGIASVRLDDADATLVGFVAAGAQINPNAFNSLVRQAHALRLAPKPFVPELWQPTRRRSLCA